MALSAGRVVADAAAEVTRLRAAYEGFAAHIESESNAVLEKWRKDYAREVERTGIAAQRAGDLEGWQAATRETSRFAESTTIPDQSSFDASPSIRALHARYRSTFAALGPLRVKRMNDLTAQYVGRLRTLQTDATRAGKLEDALAYNAELKRAQAILDAARPTPEPTPEPKPDLAPEPPPLDEANADPTLPFGEPGTTVADPSMVPTEPTFPGEMPTEPNPITPGVPEGVVIQEGNLPPAAPGTTYKPLTMTPSERMRVARRLSVRVDQAASSETQRSEDSSVGSAQRIVRLGIRSTTTSQTMEGATLVVQFYGKDAYTSGSKIVPRVIGQQKIPLPKLDASRSVYVQLPAIATERTTYRYSYYENATRYGTEFYGAVISVFDASGTLAYQAVSVLGLAALAPTSIPDDPEPVVQPLEF